MFDSAASHPTWNLAVGKVRRFVQGLRWRSIAVVATLDGDGQNDPADIPRLYERIETARYRSKLCNYGWWLVGEIKDTIPHGSCFRPKLPIQ